MDREVIDEDFNRMLILRLLNGTQRAGMPELIKWIDSETDYFTAPASARYHLSCIGGLAQHSLNVYGFFKRANKDFGLDIPQGSIAVTGLLHDLCKCNLYLKSGQSYRCDIAVKNKGHAKQSVELIQRFIELTDEEEAIIRYHMGTFGTFDYNDNEVGEYKSLDMHRAVKRYASVQIFAACDMGSSRYEKCFDK